jgi:leucyl-tRNA synthetase
MTGAPLSVNVMNDAYADYGIMVNSMQFDGLVGEDAIRKVTQFAEKQGFGRSRVN